MAPMIGRLHHLIIDCPDPPALAAFYWDAAADSPLDMVDLDAAPAFAEPPKLPEPALRSGSWSQPRQRGAAGRDAAGPWRLTGDQGSHHGPVRDLVI
jgi:hypothetical protein